METHRLLFLLELSRYGSMRAVAERLDTTTSNVSQQIAALARSVGTPLIEPEGRGVRLTPAGRRLAQHAVGILAAVDAARSDLDPTAEPTGTIRAGGFATAIRRVLLPAVAEIARSHQLLEVVVAELEPDEAIQHVLQDRIDLALVYDYNLAPLAIDPTLVSEPLWSTRWSLGVPAGAAPDPPPPDTASVLSAFGEHRWIGNSRNTADEQVLRTLGSMAGVTPSVGHRADSLDLVEDLISNGLGVGLLPPGGGRSSGVALVALADPPVVLRAHAVYRPGQRHWPPLRYLRDLITTLADAAAPV